MRTGEVAELAGVNIETLRYYERRGLLEEPGRRPSGHRAYEPHAVRVVRFIKKAQELGFTLDEVKVLLDLAGGGPESCDIARALAQRKLDEVDRRIAAMQFMRSSLQRLAATCARPPDRRECPLVEMEEIT